MLLYILVRKNFEEDASELYKVDVYTTEQEAYEKMRSECMAIVNEEAEKDSIELFNWYIYSNYACIRHPYYEVNWEIYQREVY